MPAPLQHEFLDPRALARLAQLELVARSPMEGSVSGRHQSPHRGSSVEFAEYRKYVTGDDPRHLDWRVVARSDRFYLKEFEADTNLRCYLVLDCSGSMAFGGKLAYARRLAATLAYLAVHQGDAVGLTCGPREIPPRRNPAHLQHIKTVLAEAAPAGPTHLIADLHALAEKIRTKLEGLQKETLEVLDLMFSTPSVLARFEGTGALTRETAEEIGLVGPAGRACGCPRDARSNHPHGIYQFNQLPLATETTGDVSARAVVRWLEVQRSLDFLLDILTRLPEGKTFAPLTALKSNALAIGLTETWRGEATYVAFSDAAGKVSFVQPKDPSMHNWYGLALALRNVAISDFPICNKSFSLSYCGHDL